MSTFNLRFAHFPSRVPIMLELQVDRATTVGQLRALVEQKLATEDHCLVRVFARWYLEMRAGEVRRFSELTDADGGSVLSAVGIEDECELYLEGPMMEAEHNSIGKALALMSLRTEAKMSLTIESQQQQVSLTQSLLSEVCALKKTQTMHEETLRALREDFVAAASYKQKLAKQIEEQVNFLLKRYADVPLKALAVVLFEKHSLPAFALAIVMDKRCGLERRSIRRERGLQKFLSQFLSSDTDVYDGGLTPLLMSIKARRIDVMKVFLEAGADTNAKDEYGNTALHLVIWTFRSSTVPSAIELLVGYGADLNALGFRGLAPLHVAAECCNLEVVEMLIAKGADITRVSKGGETPLGYLERRERAEIEKVPDTLQHRNHIKKLLTVQPHKNAR